MPCKLRVITSPMSNARKRKPGEENPPLTISRPELQVDGSDLEFRAFVHGMLAFAARLEAVRSGFALAEGQILYVPRRAGVEHVDHTLLARIWRGPDDQENFSGHPALAVCLSESNVQSLMSNVVLSFDLRR